MGRVRPEDSHIQVSRGPVLDRLYGDAGADTLTGNQAFHFVSSFTNHAGEATLNFDSGADVTTLQLDVNGDGVADFALLISGSVGSGAGWLL